MKKIITWGVALLATVALSVVLFKHSLTSGLSGMQVSNGDWATSLETGSADAGILLKASIAIGGLLASTRENSIYYRLHTVNGEPLRIDCQYRIEGNGYDADWWSITAYGHDHYLIPNSEKRYSFNNENIRRRDDGSWVIHLAAIKQSGNWLPVGPSGSPKSRKSVDNDFDLLLRLYVPGDAYLETPQSAPVPKVTLENCA